MTRSKPGAILTMIMVAAFAVFLRVPVAEGAIAEKNIRVGILTNQINVLITAGVPYELIDSDGRVAAQYKAQEKAAISVREAAVAINGKAINTGKLTVRIAAEGEHYIEVNKRRYRGIVEIYRTAGKGGLTVVNSLPVEQYLYGTISQEVSPDWPEEALKAQAVAARSYILSLISLNKHQADGFDVCATTDCQVYGGLDGENIRGSRAVDATRGVVITYRGKPVPAYYHSSAGGYTENSEDVWGAYLPYLRSVPDFDQKGPRYRWERAITATELEAALTNAGYRVGKLEVLELSRLMQPLKPAPDRSASGRVKTLRITGTLGSFEISGARLRSLLGLPSTLFDIHLVTMASPAIPFEITDSYGDRETKTVEVKLKPTPEKGLITDKDNMRRFSYRENEKIIITGFGYGHGVGMSQWGAKAMAEKAPAGDTAYFKTILKHYYQGVEIQKIY
ncbi:MAG: SpoIID/LytB domain-containing protein [Negativicutes bacterium]|nr:SpoIID/LytB domain-containing protein [Negativicutes bacterium]